MSVDYDASYGIGYEITNFSGYDLNGEFSYNSYCEDYLDNLLQDTDYEYIRYGEGAYSGENDTFCVILKSVLSECLFDDLNNLHKFLNQFGLSHEFTDSRIGTFNRFLVGGVLVN